MTPDRHGGGSWRLAREVAKKMPSVEWSAGLMERLQLRERTKQVLEPSTKLTVAEILDEGTKYMQLRGLGDARFQRYGGPQ